MTDIAQKMEIVSHTPALKPYRVELMFHILSPKENEEMRSKILTYY